MSLKDKEKWDAKYLTKSQLLKPREASQNLIRWISHCEGNKALDLACGSGRNTLYLADKDFHVDAVDIASIALDALQKEAKNRILHSKINTILIDLDKYEVQKNKYDLILMTNFLDRKLLKRSQDALKKGGIFFIETYMINDENEKTKSDISNLLQSQELKNLFSDSFEILYYDEFKNEDYEIYKMQKQVIVVKKIKD